MGLFAFLSTQTLIIVLVVALIVFGPQKLPDIGRQLGSAMRELRKMSGDMQRALDIDTHTSSYDYYGSSRYDSASSYSYTPPSDTPLDQYGLDHPAPAALEGDSSGAVDGVDSASQSEEVVAADTETPKRKRARKASVEAGAESGVAEESTDEAPESKPRRSRRKAAESAEASTPDAEIPAAVASVVPEVADVDGGSVNDENRLAVAKSADPAEAQVVSTSGA